jgi:hypothetical protein
MESAGLHTTGLFMRDHAAASEEWKLSRRERRVSFGSAVAEHSLLPLFFLFVLFLCSILHPFLAAVQHGCATRCCAHARPSRSGPILPAPDALDSRAAPRMRSEPIFAFQHGCAMRCCTYMCALLAQHQSCLHPTLKPPCGFEASQNFAFPPSLPAHLPLAAQQVGGCGADGTGPLGWSARRNDGSCGWGAPTQESAERAP